ncbi:MAG: hypothetical protein ABIK64_06750 [Bacillota bacterium]
MSDAKINFRSQSIRKATTVDKLDDYIRVTNPSVWLILGTVAVIVVCGLVWSVLGYIPTTLTKPFVSTGDAYISFFPPDEAAMIQKGMKADVNGNPGTIQAVASTPISQADAAALLSGDYEVHVLELTDWNVQVTVECSKVGDKDTFANVKITTDTVHQISFLVN